MHSATKPVLMKSIQAGFLLLGLAACSDTSSVEAPHIFGAAEVPQEVLNEPRLVTTPQPVDLDTVPWPRLGDVPFKPNNFTPLPKVYATMDQMAADRAEAEAKKQEIGQGNVSAPVPSSVP